MPAIITPWTDDRVATLEKYVEAGLSCSQIAAELGGTTRNAVIGKMNRLGLHSLNPPHGGSKEFKKFSPQKRKAKVSIFATRWGVPDPERKLPNSIEVAHVVAEPRHVPLARLNNITCRWPYGDGPFTFCGCPTTRAPYCEAHTEQSISKAAKSDRLEQLAEAVAA